MYTQKQESGQQGKETRTYSIENLLVAAIEIAISKKFSLYVITFAVLSGLTYRIVQNIQMFGINIFNELLIYALIAITFIDVWRIVLKHFSIDAYIRHCVYSLFFPTMFLITAIALFSTPTDTSILASGCFAPMLLIGVFAITAKEKGIKTTLEQITA